MGKGENVTLKPVMNPGAETTFTYKSKNKKVAAVGKATGVVKGKKVKKSTKITVKTQNRKTAKLTVKVLKAPTGVTLNTGSASLGLGAAMQLVATLPAKTASQITWSSSNPGVVAVSEATPFTAGNGGAMTVTAVGSGSAVITASTFNGKTASCTINVDAPAPAPAPAPVENTKAIDGANFPDETFRNWVAEHCDIDHNGELSEAEMSVESIALTDEAAQPIQSLAGIENFPNLKNLNASGTGITELDVSKNPNLVACVINGDLNSANGKDTYTHEESGSTLTVKEGVNNITPRPVTELREPQFTVSTSAVVVGRPVEITITNDDKQEKRVRYVVELLKNSSEKIVDGAGENGTYSIDTTGVEPGNYTVSVRADREGYDSKSHEETITVKADLVAPGLTLSGADTIIQGEQIEFTVDMGEQPTEACTFTALISDASGNPVQTAPVDGTSMIISTADLAPGIYTVVLTVSAEGDYTDKSSEPRTFTVKPDLVVPAVELSSTSVSQGMPVTFTVTPVVQPVAGASYAVKLLDDADAEVTDVITAQEGNVYTIATDGLTKDTTYTVVATVSAEGYDDKSAEASFTVTAGLNPPTVALSPDNVSVGMPLEITVSGEQPVEETYEVKLFKGDEDMGVTVNPDGDKFTIDTAGLEAGEYTVKVTASAGDGYVPQIAMQSFTLNAALEKPMLSLDVDTIEIWNEDLVVTITNVPSTPEVSYTATLVGVEITPVPTWDAAKGTLTIDTSTLGSGTHQLVITASADGYLPVASDPASFDVDVINLNDFIVNVKDHAVVDYEGLDSNITLPEVDDKGAPITAIGENAFVENTGIKTVTISKDIVTIGESAFEGCTALTSVTIPNGVTTIGKAAFKNCSALKTMTPYN